jgi:hypothetical protein
MDLPPEVAKDPQFRSVLAMADEYYAKANADPSARSGFKNLDDYVATQLYLKTSGPVRDWLERASGTLSTQSAEGRAAIAAKQQGYQEWAKTHTGWRGYLNDQLSIAKAELEGARGGASIVANTLSHGLSDKLHVTDSEQYQGKDYRVARVTALIGREALEFAAGAEIGKLAEGGYRAAQLANRAQQGYALYQSAGQAKEGFEQIVKDPTDWHGTVNLIVGMGGAVLGAHGLGGDLKAADKVVSEVSTAEKVVKEAAPLEKAASQAGGEVAKEAGAAEKAVTKGSGAATKEAETAASTEKAAARTESPSPAFIVDPITGVRTIRIDPATFGKTKAGQLIAGTHELVHAEQWAQALASHGGQLSAAYNAMFKVSKVDYAIREVITERAALRNVAAALGRLSPRQIAHSTRYINYWQNRIVFYGGAPIP